MARELEIQVTAEVQQALEALKRAQAAIDGLGEKTEDTGTSFDTLSGKIAKFATAASAMYLAEKAFSAVIGSMKSVAMVALDMNANLEKSTLQFTTLMGDSQKAEEHVRSLFEFAKKTPFETGPIITASKHLQLFGGDALNSQKNLKLLGDAAAASGAQFEEVAFWTGRMYASLQAGKPVGEAMMRLMELGVVAPTARAQIEALAQTAGGGQKAFEAFQESLGQFTGAMDLQANTWDGLMSTIKDAAQITLADALKPFFEMAKEGAAIIAQVLGSDAVQQVFRNMAESIKASFGTNSQEQVRNMLKAFLLFGEGVLIVSDGVVRALSGIKLVFSVAAWTIAQTNSALNGFSEAMVDSAKSSWEGVMGQGVLSKSLQGVTQILETMRQEIDKVTISQNTNTDSTNANAGAKQQLGAAHVATAAEIKKAEAEAKKFQDTLSAIIRMEAKPVPLTRIFDFSKQISDNGALLESQKKFTEGMTFYSGQASQAWVPFAKSVERMGVEAKGSMENFSAAFGNIGPTIVGALQGGGNAFKAVGASLFGGLGQDLGKALASKIGGTLGQSLGSFAGPVGSILGGLAGDLAGKLFGNLFGNANQKAVTNMRDKFFEMGGGIDVMRERAQAAGVPMDGLFNVKNPKDMEAAIKAFNKELKAAEERAAKAKEELAKMNTEMGGLLREADKLGVTLPDSIQASIDKLKESGQLTEENRKLLEGLGAGSQSEFRAMEEAAKKYGVELSALGPAFNQNKINERAADIIGAFDTMMKGGANVTGVITGMADEINAFVQDAIKMGTTVPENMRPVLEAMMQQGKLTDINGKKLEDLGSIKFGAPVETAIDKLINKIQELVDKMSDGLTNSFKTAAQQADSFSRKATDAINSVPREIDVRFAGYGPDAVGFDRGGVVGRDYRRATSRDVIPALLRPGEVVLTPEQAASGTRGAATSVAVTINVAGYLDSPTARAGLADIVRDELSKNLRRVGRAA